MRAAWYEKQGPAREVLVVGEIPHPRPAEGEVRIRIATSGINPGRKCTIRLARACSLVLRRTVLSPVRDSCGVHRSASGSYCSAP